VSTEFWLPLAITAASAAAIWMIVRGVRRRLAHGVWRLPEDIQDDTLRMRSAGSGPIHARASLRGWTEPTEAGTV